MQGESVNYKGFPSIWLGDFFSKSDYDSRAQELSASFSVFDHIDDRLLYSRHPMAFPAYCAVCGRVTTMHVNWMFSGGAAGGSIHPAWTESCVCAGCGLNSRMRALMDFLKTRGRVADGPVYVAEQTTPSYRKLKELFATLTGSEYLGPQYRSGDMHVTPAGQRVRHEDLTALSFADDSFVLAITQDVFEHVPNYRQAFCELHRVLRSKGRLVFTIPFFFDLGTTIVRATVGPEGTVHHLPPEIHGNPVSENGSLCYQNFGWDILEELAAAGFADACASMYWGPWQGHMGFPFFVFSATKP